MNSINNNYSSYINNSNKQLNPYSKSAKEGHHTSTLGAFQSVTQHSKQSQEASLSLKKSTFKKQTTPKHASTSSSDAYHLGVELTKNNNFKEAFKAFKKCLEVFNKIKKPSSAQKKHASFAATHVGIAYHYGKDGINKNLHLALEYYSQAVDLGCIEAQYNRGILLDSELEKYEEAAQDYQEAIRYGHWEARYNLAILLFDYLDKQDPEQAMKHLQECAAKGEALKTHTDDPEDVNLLLGRVYYQMAYSYEKGRGVEKSMEQAVLYYEKACELNNEDACLNMGILWEEGLVPPTNKKDYEKAREYYAMANDFGYGDAAYHLGLLNEKKLIKGASKQEAYYLFSRAYLNARTGNDNNDQKIYALALNKLGFYQMNGLKSIFSKNHFQALEFFHIALQKISIEADEYLDITNNLGECYLRIANDHIRQGRVSEETLEALKQAKHYGNSRACKQAKTLIQKKFKGD